METVTVENSAFAITVAPEEGKPESVVRAVQLQNVAGKNMGFRMSFVSDNSARSLRETFKVKGMKGKELTAAVNDALNGRRNVAQIMAQAAMQELFQKGLVPTDVKINQKGTKAAINLEAPKVAAEKVKTMGELVAAMTEKEKADLKAMLDAEVA